MSELWVPNYRPERRKNADFAYDEFCCSYIYAGLGRGSSQK